MDKELLENMQKLMAITASLSTCSTKNCNELKKIMMQDTEYTSLNTQYVNEKNTKKKEKLLDKISENELLHNYNKCILKHCKEIYKY